MSVWESVFVYFHLVLLLKTIFMVRLEYLLDSLVFSLMISWGDTKMCWTSIIKFKDENPEEYKAALERVVIKK